MKRKNQMFDDIPMIITEESQVLEMAACIERANREAARAKAWKDAAAETIRRAINSGEAYEDDDASATGRVYKAGVPFGKWAVTLTTNETVNYSAHAMQALLTVDQLEQCRRYGSRTVVRAERVREAI